LDIKSKVIKDAFAKELTHLDEYKFFIQKNLKEKIMDDAKGPKPFENQEKVYIKPLDYC
jgi:hypothetical protein